jgi:acetolactate synthase-1/2/3 large subunit
VTAPSDAARPRRYADQVMDWLVDLGYTHCFFVAGGNIMHLLDAARSRMQCVPFVHEVAAGIAAEYFNETSTSGRAFAMVTAGPGLTNIVTAVAGAFLESRELLVIGGQVKSTDLATGGLRQRGIQEIDGAAIVRPIAVVSQRIERAMPRAEFEELALRGRRGRPGPVFLEICLDVQGAPADAHLEGARASYDDPSFGRLVEASLRSAPAVAEMIAEARRPVFLVGGGVTRAAAAAALPGLRRIGIPVMTTWNGIDRIAADEAVYFGRPNTWGQRYANVLLQQADLVVAFGTRLGLQQTGFNWQQFVPLGRVVQVEIDPAELRKGHPRVDFKIEGDANALLRDLTARAYPDFSEWRAFCDHVKATLPLRDPANSVRDGYVCPYDFYQQLSVLATPSDVVIPCSSGGANSTGLQTFAQKAGQTIVGDKGLASMGYGLSGAIGAALASPGRRTIVIEGDGGFIQNLQELGTVAVNGLDLKIFIFSNEGYASIRTTQRNYFGGAYVGCDTRTGLGFPDWTKLFDAYGIGVFELAPGALDSPAFRLAFETKGPQAFIVPVDPEQTYYPKISSRVVAGGSMESNPLHLMTPELEPTVAEDVLRYLMRQAVAAR